MMVGGADQYSFVYKPRLYKRIYANAGFCVQAIAKEGKKGETRDAWSRKLWQNGIALYKRDLYGRWNGGGRGNPEAAERRLLEHNVEGGNRARTLWAAVILPTETKTIENNQ